MSNEYWNQDPLLAEWLEHVRVNIKGTLSGARGYIRPHLQDIASQQGKMLRPALLILASWVGSGSSQQEEVTALAAGIELVHAASLIHDDIIDEASARRGEETLHRRIGNRKAVVAGDYILVRAFALLSQDMKRSYDSKVVSDRMAKLCESEIDQDSEIGNFFIPKSRYIRRIGGKTAALFSLSCYLGASAGKLDAGQVRALSRFGYNLGISFQMHDDILDITGRPNRMGKDVGKDLTVGIATLPLICALEMDRSGKLKRMLDGAVPGDRQIPEIIAEIHRIGGVDAARRTARSYEQQANRELSRLPACDARESLSRLLHRLAKRQS